MGDKAVDFDKQMAAEREYYLKGFDPEKKVPGTEVTMGEAREAYRKAEVKDRKAREERRVEVAKAQGTIGLAPTFTTTISNQTVEVKTPEPAVREENLFADNLTTPQRFGHTRESLSKLTKEQLMALGEEDISHLFPSSMSKENMIALLLGETFEPPAKNEPPTPPVTVDINTGGTP